jgi:RHS repeat-associated protein
VSSIRDSLGTVETRTYDERGRLVARADGEGEATDYTYRPDEMLELVDGPGGRSLYFDDYGAHGHARTVWVRGEERRLAFDAVGNRLAGDDPLGEAGPGAGGIRQAGYDGNRNARAFELVAQSILLQPDDPRWLEVDVRSDGRPIRIRRPHGGDTELDYDALGRVVARRERVDGVWQTTRFEVDAAGRVTAALRPNGMREEWAFDALGRTVRRAIWRHGTLQSEAHFTYDRGRLVEVDDSAHDAPEQVVYDAAGRPAIVVFPGGEQLWIEFDVRSRVVREQYVMPGAQRLLLLERRYDGADREVELLVDGRTLLDRTYRDGQLKRTRYANGLKHALEVDPTTGERTAARLVVAGSGVVLAERIHERVRGYACIARYCLRTRGWSALSLGLPDAVEEQYQVGQVGDRADDTGKRLLVSREFDAGLLTVHQYDQLSNRTAYTCDADPGPEVEWVSAVFNPERNRLQRIDAPPACATRAHTYRYDEAGFAVERDGMALAWDGAGRIAAVGDEAEFAWDTRGAPLWRRIGTEVVRHRFGGRVEADLEGRPVALQHPEIRIDLVSGEHRFRHLDFRGNVLWVSDHRGEVIRHLVYGAYGPRVELGDADDPYDFARALRAGSLRVLGHRVFDPHAAAFLAPDPIVQLVNAYAYTLGNPVWFWDPDGRHARPAAARPPGVSAYAWGAFIGAMSMVGGSVGFAAGGPVGGAVGGLLGFAVANHVYQVATGRQGVGFDQFVEEFSPLIVPRDGSPASAGLAPGHGLDVRPGERGGYARIGPARWHGPRHRSGDPPDAELEVVAVGGGPACGLGFEAGAVIAALLARRCAGRHRAERGKS